MIRNFAYKLIFLLISLLICCEKDKTECDFITIFEEDFESCSTSECSGWTGHYEIIACDSTSICGNKVMWMAAEMCPPWYHAIKYLTGLSEANIIRLTMNYKFQVNIYSCNSGLTIYNRENIFKSTKLNCIDTLWNEIVLIDTIHFNDNDTLIIEIGAGCHPVNGWNLFVDNIKVEKSLLGPCL